MWGKTIGDGNMEARGNLMLSILARTLHNYFLMDSSNQNQPPGFIQNKVTGIVSCLMGWPKGVLTHASCLRTRRTTPRTLV